VLSLVKLQFIPVQVIEPIRATRALFAWSTVWLALPVLVAKRVLPGYVALIVRGPLPAGVNSQLPTPPLRVASQLAEPSLTATVPSGVPADDCTSTTTVIASPSTDGSGLMLRMLVVVPAGGGGLTACDSVSLLAVNPALPPYSAVSVVVPAPGASVQLPWATVALQLPPPSALTSTVPSGVPDDEVTVKLTVTVCPSSEGSGASPVIVVVVLAGGGAVTVCPSVSELGSNPSAPEYVAVSVRSPTVPRARSQLPSPAARVPVQDEVPSLTVTVPVGVAPAEATRKPTVKLEPLTDGSGLSLMIAVVVEAGDGATTVWPSVSELDENPSAPEYVAVSVLSPSGLRVSWQLPVPPLRVEVHDVLPSPTVTLPVGVPPPSEVTWKFTVTVAPLIDGSGLSLVIVVAVEAGGGGGWAVTVWPSSSELAENPGAPE
jgi:hypothetical protein